MLENEALQVAAQNFSSFPVDSQHSGLTVCATCGFRNANFCGNLEKADADGFAAAVTYKTAKSKQTLQRAGTTVQGVTIVCEGWAIKYVQMHNGKRQALSLVQPGEMISPAAAFETKHAYSVQALTPIKFAIIAKEFVNNQLQRNSKLRDAWSRRLIAHLRDTQQLLIDLGQRSAEERIAALVIRISRRYGRLEYGPTIIPFPLNQQQIADITGLTPVHVCRVLQSLRDNDICDIRKSQAYIGNYQRLAKMASPQDGRLSQSVV